MKWGFLTISILLFNLVATLIKKRLKTSEIYTTVIFGLLVSSLVDVYASFRYNAWGFFEVEKAELSAILILLGIYPAATIMIINWYPYKCTWNLKLTYLMGWAIFSTLYEWLTIKSGVIWHNNWNLFYSFVMYPFIYYLLILHVKVYRWMQQRR
ncbi:hypothetical protein DFO73_101505 [Cytobacillus oceanisediminis]|uniref:Uncharacterized protein n=1 Tax=Cytobacillus oceanisediminis TaxID=665099 RepID=A0A2V3A5G6_9BACI|nr:CBO0543 family protein [Cytobacillus oceanisediminis]PWW32242.1 hypothetical protein DFO73_101505 [Cytobacillus oceanisediminis]